MYVQSWLFCMLSLFQQLHQLLHLHMQILFESLFITSRKAMFFYNSLSSSPCKVMFCSGTKWFSEKHSFPTLLHRALASLPLGAVPFLVTIPCVTTAVKIAVIIFIDSFPVHVSSGWVWGMEALPPGAKLGSETVVKLSTWPHFLIQEHYPDPCLDNSHS